MRWKTIAAVLCGASCALALAPAAAAAQTAATAYVVHGIPDTPVDVYVDGQRAINDFQPGTVLGPVQLPPGPHEVTLYAANTPDNSGTPLLRADANVQAGANLSLVAHLTVDGEPTITPFANDVAPVPAGEARLVVRHTAAAPAVDVRAGGQPVVTGLTNPNQRALEVPSGTVSADVTLAGTDQVVLGPANLNLSEGTATFVHAIGSASEGDLSLVSFTISGLHSAPSGVPAGSGTPASGAPWAALGAVGLLVLAGGAMAGRLRRSPR